MKKLNYSDITQDFYEYKDFLDIDSVSEIINDVRKNGDDAIRKYSEKFGDGIIESFEITKKEIDEAFEKTDKSLIAQLELAIKNVQDFAQAQINSINETEIELNGAKLGQKIIPLERIGAYVPGGNYPLPSSAIMSCVPAKVAGVKEVIVCSPRIQNVTIVAAKLAGADRIYKVGGVQAIAAMAYGTETIPKVDKITGPGNKYVTAAKKQVYGACGIDFLAGPSEVMIIADKTANPEFIAADMLAQCEHDADASAVLITDSLELIKEVEDNIENFLLELPTADIARQALENSYMIIVDNIEQAIEIANKKAPEHLEICFENAYEQKDKFNNYGSLFIGNYSAEVFGDYCSGTNHVLPTNGVARYSGGLSVFDFIKIQTYQQISKQSAQNIIGPCASEIANTEGLMAHKLSADLRIKK